MEVVHLEMVTGIDIIKEQINIAFTGETALKQEDVKPRGHAIECRINAEDASKNFQPSPGTIGMCHQPSGFRTRVDGAIYQGYKVTPYYDSMVCKVIVQGRNRTEAIQRTLRSLDEFVLEGITTTIDFNKLFGITGGGESLVPQVNGARIKITKLVHVAD